MLHARHRIAARGAEAARGRRFVRAQRQGQLFIPPCSGCGGGRFAAIPSADPESSADTGGVEGGGTYCVAFTDITCAPIGAEGAITGGATMRGA